MNLCSPQDWALPSPIFDGGFLPPGNAAAAAPPAQAQQTGGTATSAAGMESAFRGSAGGDEDVDRLQQALSRWPTLGRSWDTANDPDGRATAEGSPGLAAPTGKGNGKPRPIALENTLPKLMTATVTDNSIPQVPSVLRSHQNGLGRDGPPRAWHAMSSLPCT